MLPERFCNAMKHLVDILELEAFTRFHLTSDMAGLKKTDSLDWLLMEWKSGSRTVVHLKSLVSPLDEDLKPGDVIKLNWRGEQETAKLIAHARDRNKLDAMVKKSVKEEPGPNCKRESSFSSTYEEVENYSCSGSSWALSDDEEWYADSEMEDIPVKPKMREKTSIQSTAIRNYSKKRHTSLTKIKSIGNLLPDSENGEEIEEVVDKMDEVNDAFTNMFNLISNLKRQCEKIPNSTEDVEMLLNAAADNVLSTNKYNFAESEIRVEDEWVPIGSGKTLIHKDKFRKVNWRSYTFATRTLLVAAFSRRILATHSLTGKKSPAFQEKAAKMCLDPKIISDIIIEVTDRFNVRENVVRKIITNKCADESKMYKTCRN